MEDNCTAVVQVAHLCRFPDLGEHDVTLLLPARVDKADAHVLRHLLNGDELACRDWGEGNTHTRATCHGPPS